jgi:nucleoside-diphosphate-sugar epimerase
LIAIDNLVSLLALCVNSPVAANQIFIAADDEALTLSEIITNLRKGMRLPPRVISVHESVLCMGASLVGRGRMFDKLNTELLANNCKSKEVLNWLPPVSAQQALQKVGRIHLENKRNAKDEKIV